MANIDDKIRAALHAEDRELYDELGELSLIEQVIASFRSRSRWLVVLVMIYSFFFLGLCIYCAMQFFAATEVKSMIAWACGLCLGMIAVMALKIWYWMELHRMSVIREIKRLELQISLAGSYNHVSPQS